VRQPFDGSFPVSSGFGPRVDPITGATGSPHWGIDFGLPPFTPLLAVAAGTIVVAVDEGAGFGQTVTILLDDPPPGANRVGYGHMAQIDVIVGQHVAEGERIGLSGGAAGMVGAGSSTGAHLHLWTGDGPNPPLVTDPTPIFIGGAHSLNDSDEDQDDDVKALYITKKSDPTVGTWVSDGMWRRHVLPTEWEFVKSIAALAGQPGPAVVELVDEWWNSIPVAGT
jgi:hypothetical protein